MKITSDIHTHTYLSSCAARDSWPWDFMKVCGELGIKTLGFSDHLWDKAVPGASKWYAPQDVDHVFQLKEQLASQQCQEAVGDMKILFGCETEFLGGKHVALSREAAKLFDFVLIPPDHFHMKGFTVPADLNEPKDIKELMIRRFMEVMELDMATAVVHPFHAMGWTPEMPRLIQSMITDNEYIECFTAAKQTNCAIEINTCAVKPVEDGVGDDSFSPEYVRMMTLARETGCVFSIGSDSHNPKSIAAFKYDRFERFTELCGIESILYQ